MYGVPRSGAFGAVAAGLALSAALNWPQSSMAGQWRATPTISVTETFTDNATLANESEDRNSDFITLIEPGVTVRGSGGRINLNFDYSLRQKMYLRDTRPNSLRNNFLGGGDVELWEDVLTLQGQGSISREIVNGRQPASGSLAGEDVNSATVRTFNVTPIFRHHFGTVVDTETRVTYSQTDTSEPNTDDTTTLSEKFRASSGRQFSVLLWSFDVDNSRESTDGVGPDTRQFHADGTFTYVVSPRFSLISGLGYERVRSEDLEKQPTGLTWKLGFDSRPGPVTALSASFGERDDELSVNATASHQFSPLTSVNASYSESIQTTSQLFSRAIQLVAVDPNGNVLINPNTQQPFTLPGRAFGLENGTFRQRLFSLGLNGSRRRFNFGGDIFYETREFEVQNRTEVAYGGGLRFSQSHTPRLSSGLGLNYRRLDPDEQPNRIENEGSVSANLAYQVSSTVSAVLAYDFTLRRTDKSPDDVHENAVSLTLRKTF